MVLENAYWHRPSRLFSSVLPIGASDDIRIALEPYVLSPEQRWAMGYPMQLEPNSTKAVFYIHPPPRNAVTTLDVNASEFIPAHSNDHNGRRLFWRSNSKSDSDDDSSESTKQTCVRCGKSFRITREGKYVEEEVCARHCDLMDNRRQPHVWNGTRSGMNGPLEGFVRTRTARGGVFALDAEMCYTTAGLELASIAIVGADGRVVYSTKVRPSADIVDCNTRFSGIQPQDLARATKSLRDVQNDILEFVGADTVLVGHALDNDLRALKLLHGLVVDTCTLFPHARGLPLRRSLRSLALEYLGRRVQCSVQGHDPVEDARTAMDLVWLKRIHDIANPSSPLLSDPSFIVDDT